MRRTRAGRERWRVWIPCIFAAGLAVSALPPAGRADPSSAGAGGPAIVNATADRTVFRPSAGEEAAIRFRLTAPARVTLRVWDSADRLVRRMDGMDVLPAADGSVTWDGRDQDGRIVPDEAYVFTLEATAPGGGGSVIYDPTDADRGRDFQVEGIALDRATGAVTYALPGPSRVGIRISWGKSGPMVRTLVNWEPRPGGAQREEWDGWDASRVLNLRELSGSEVELNGIAFRLPRNSLIVEGGGDADPQWAAGLPEVRRERRPEPHLMFHHYQHLRDVCFDPPIHLGLAAAEGYDPITRDAVTVQVTARPDIERMLADQRVEMVFYVDGVFAHEEELGYLPFTWVWNPAGLAGTEHRIHALMLGYEGHWATAGLKVRLPEAGVAGGAAGAARDGADRG